MNTFYKPRLNLLTNKNIFKKFLYGVFDKKTVINFFIMKLMILLF